MDYQDVLAMVGAGSAHPGGMLSTIQWIESLPLTPDSQVLEVGCGTGRTLSLLAARYNCDCTGVDVRKTMIDKARERSRLSGVSIRFEVADAMALPFKSDNFDLVFTESVNVFVADIAGALAEYLRVLRPGGRYLDVEMALMSPVDKQWKEEVNRVYGARTVPDIRGWKKHLTAAGLVDVRVVQSKPVDPMDMVKADSAHPETVDLSSPGVYNNPEVMKILSENSNWLEHNHRHMGFVVLEGKKAKAAAHNYKDKDKGTGEKPT